MTWRTATKEIEAFMEQAAICKWLHLTNLNWCQTHMTHFLNRYMHFSVQPAPLLTWHEQKSFYSQRDTAVPLCLFYRRIIQVSRSVHHYLQFKAQLCHLCNGMRHLHFPNVVLVLMHLHSDNRSKVNAMSWELTGLRVFANCITTKPSLKQKMRPSS